MSDNDIKKYLVDGYLPTIGIECHVQLKTRSKLFSSVSNEAREASPNTLVNHICFGLPGALPVLNEEAVSLSVRAAFALGTEPQRFSKFDRKHYFYPDLPKGYQISQFDQPIILGGSLKLHMEDGSDREIHITRAHLEEDAGKSTHPTGGTVSLVDLNRAGTPLLEIVSEPEIHSAAEAKAYAKELWIRMKYADVSDVDLYHGNMRFDVNVSVSKDVTKLGTRSETKNLNSFRSVERAIEYEVKRQVALLEQGESVVQETRGWLDDQQKTVSQRSKEDAHDYRYFPDPDIPPVILDENYIKAIKDEMPTMPDVWRSKLVMQGIDQSQIENLIQAEVEFDLKCLDLLATSDKQKALIFSNWITNIEIPLRRKQNISTADTVEIPTRRLQVFQRTQELVEAGRISSNGAKQLIEELLYGSSDLDTFEHYAEEKGLLQLTDANEMHAIVDTVIQENPKPVNDVKNGELKAIGYLVGQIMKASQGKANPAEAQKILRDKLEI